jgi:hypothetical protein
MSKNQDRYKEDYVHTDLEQLEEMETEHFEKFKPKKKDAKATDKKKPSPKDE